MLIFILLFLGMSFGSFVNAFVYRLFEVDKHTYGIGFKKSRKSSVNMSILNGRSVCVKCKHQLSALDLIPLFSWLGLRGRCRYCKHSISWQYPVVELVSAVLFVFSYLYWPVGLSGVYAWVIFSFWLVYLIGFMSLIVFDIRWMLLPNRIVFGLLGVFSAQLTAMLVFGGLSLSELLGIVLGGCVVSGLFWALFQVSGGKWIAEGM